MQGCPFNMNISYFPGPSYTRLPPHPNISPVLCTFADEIPCLPDGISSYPAALPAQYGEGCYGRNRTMFLVMPRLVISNLIQSMWICNMPMTHLSCYIHIHCIWSVGRLVGWFTVDPVLPVAEIHHFRQKDISFLLYQVQQNCSNIHSCKQDTRQKSGYTAATSAAGRLRTHGQIWHSTQGSQD